MQGKMKLYNSAPYLGRIISEVTVKIVNPDDPNVQTMAVDNFGNLYLNPNFSTKLNNDEFLGVFAHEMLHIANGTHLRAKGKIFKLWNVATDAVMNYSLVQAGFKLPANGIIPDLNGVFVFKNTLGKEIGRIKVTDAQNEPINAEQVYNQLLKIKEQLEEKGGGKQGGNSGSKDIEVIEDFDGTTDKHLTNEEASQTSKDVIDELTPEQSDKLEQERQNKLSSMGNGTQGAASIRNLISKSIPIKINWRAIITQYLKQLDKLAYNWQMPKKRALVTGYYAPSKQAVPNKLTALICIDSSGSIGDKEFKTFIEGIEGMMSVIKKVNVHIALWHTNVYYVSDPITSVKDLHDTFKYLNVQSGGTTISCTNKTINNFNSDLTIFFTDGDVDNDDIKALTNKSKKLFLILNNHFKQDIRKIFNSKGQTLVITHESF